MDPAVPFIPEPVGAFTFKIDGFTLEAFDPVSRRDFDDREHATDACLVAHAQIMVQRSSEPGHILVLSMGVEVELVGDLQDLLLHFVCPEPMATDCIALQWDGVNLGDFMV